MIDALLQIAKAFGLIVLLGAGWYGLQAVLGRTGISAGDLMRGRWGCAGCAGDTCATEPGGQAAEAG
jgi:hypothetical protein